MGRDVGTLGERTVAAWCSQADMRVNPSDEDKRGWDHLIEFTLKDHESGIASAPPDRDFREVKSFVQIKSTDSQRRNVSIKLSNWRYLTTGTPHPCFILCLEFDGADEPQRAYLIHVGEDLIERVLQRLRELSGEGTQLYESSMSVTYGEEERLENESGSALRAAIVETITGNPIQYKSWKRRYLTEVGYEGAILRVQGHAEVPSDYEGSPEEFIADLSAGLVPSIDLEVDEAQDLRFGEPASLPSFPEQISMAPDHKTEEVKLVLSACGYSYTRERITAELYRPNELLGQVSAGRRKLRLSIPYANLILAEGTQPLRVDVNFPSENVAVPLADLQPLAKLILFSQQMYEEGREFTVEIHNFSGAESALTMGSLSGEDFESEETLEMASQRIRNAWSVWKALDVENQVEVTVSHLLEKWKEYHLLEQAFRGEGVPATFEYGVHEPYEEIYGTPDLTVAIPYPLILETPIPEAILGLVLMGEPEALGEKDGLHHYELTAEETEVVYSETFLKDEETPFDDVMEIRELCAERVDEEENFVHVLAPVDERRPGASDS